MFYTEGYDDKLEEVKRCSWVGYIYILAEENCLNIYLLYTWHQETKDMILLKSILVNQ